MTAALITALGLSAFQTAALIIGAHMGVVKIAKPQRRQRRAPEVTR